MHSSSIAKVWESVSKYGLRAGLENAAARWARGKLSAPYDVPGDYAWILTKDEPARLPPPDGGPLKINWLLPSISQNGGGELNIFRAIHYLEQWGHKNRVYVLDCVSANGADARARVRKHYFPIESSIELFAGDVADSDALVATNWVTAYAVRGLGNTARKFYFVQDLENRFYAAGSLAAFAEETYRWGFHGITLGKWIAQELRGEFSMPCSSFGFSYDRSIYSAQGPRSFSDGRKRVLYYARPSSERRGFELGVLALLQVARRSPGTEFVLVGFSGRGHIPFPAILPGILPPSELSALYRSCSAALVLSHTNLSMLPLELMACGCPVVSNTGPNVEWLLTQEVSQLAQPTPDALAQDVLELLNDNQLRAEKVEKGLSFAQQTDWVREIKEIESAFYDGMKLTTCAPTGALVSPGVS